MSYYEKDDTPRPFGDSFIDYSSLSPAVLDSIGSGWIQIKYLVGNSNTWYTGNEDWDYTFTEFLFTRGDFSAWFIRDKFQAVTKSSINETPYTEIWYNRGYLLDPVLSLRDSNISEVEHNKAARYSISPSGVYVFIR